MSYYDRPRQMSGRYHHPYDQMVDAFNRMNEAFYTLSESMAPRYSDRGYFDRMMDRPYYDRPMLERSYYDKLYGERGAERGQTRPLEKTEQSVKEMEKTEGRPRESHLTPQTQSSPTSREHEAVGLFKRPVMDVLGIFDEPFFKSHWETHSTLDRAHRLIDEMMSKGQPNIGLSRSDELLQIPEDLKEVYREFGSKEGSQITGTSYQTSNITKDGKTVTVVRKSKLNPDGSISTKVSQHYDDGAGHRDTKSRKKVIHCKTGAVSEKVGSEKKKESIEHIKKDESHSHQEEEHAPIQAATKEAK